MSLRQKAIKGVFWSAIQKWGSQLISTGVFILLARLLGAEAFGLVALAGVYLSFVQLFMDQGLGQAIIQRKELEPEHLDTAFWIGFGLGFFFTLCSLVAAQPIADIFGEPELANVLRWLSINFTISGLSGVQGAILSRNFQFRVFALRSLLATAISGVVGVYLAFCGYGVWSLVFKEITFSTSGVVLLWWASSWRPGFRFSKNHFKELFSFGINIAGFNVLSFLNRRSDNLLIGFYLGPTTLGYYAIAYKLFEIISQVMTNTIGQIALPVFSRMQDDIDALRKAFYTATQFSGILSIPAFIGISILSPEIVNSVLGSEWQSSIPVIRVLSFVGIIQSIYYFNGTVLVSMGKPNWRLSVYFLNTLINLISFMIVVRWGIVAVSIAFTLRSYILSPIPLVLIKRLINIDFMTYFSNIYPALFSTALMSIVLIMFKLSSLSSMESTVALTIGISLGMVSYAAALYIFYREIVNKILEILKSPFSKVRKTHT
jgi:PST family polysaccharide transporter